MSELPPTVEVFVRFRSLFARVHSTYEQDAKTKGVSGMETLLLLHLAGPKRMGELAELLLCMPSNITALVDRLEQAGFVQRERCPDDRRVTQVVLTDKGESLRDQLVEKTSSVIGDITGLSEQNFLDILDTLNHH